MSWDDEPKKEPAPLTPEGCIAVGECRPRHRSTKDTRNWCKGHVGMAHEYHWVRIENGYARRSPELIARFQEICRECGKQSGRRKSRCVECHCPVWLGWDWKTKTNRLTIHGQHCSLREYMFGFFYQLHSMAELASIRPPWGPDYVHKANQLISLAVAKGTRL